MTALTSYLNCSGDELLFDILNELTDSNRFIKDDILDYDLLTRAAFGRNLPCFKYLLDLHPNVFIDGELMELK